MKRFIILGMLMAVMLFALTGCGSEEASKNASRQNATSNSAKSSKNTSQNTNKEETKVNIDYAAAAEKQMAAPVAGEQIAIMHVKDYGDIKLKFFPEVAPKAVENFTTHAKEGYYNGVTFHRVINEFMIQGGDPLGNGTGGESIWGTDFAEELADELVPYRGSLCMASRGLQNSPSLGSQFFITQANYDKSMASYMSSYPKALLEQYKKYGGNIYSLYMQYTVFGQVYEGMEVVDKIAAAETDANDKPVQDVVIESIDVTTAE